MFRRRHTTTSSMPRAPRSSVLGCLGAIFLCGIAIWALLRAGEVVKWLGQPFLLLPDALGLIERPSSDDVIVVTGSADSWLEVALPQSGPYQIFLDIWDGWGEGPELFMQGPDGQVYLEPAQRGVRPYDTPHAVGILWSRFRIEQAGPYDLHFGSPPAGLLPDQTFTFTVVPDYNTGKENLIAWAIALQIALFVLVVLIILYLRYGRTAKVEAVGEDTIKAGKRERMEEFLRQRRSDHDS